MNKSNVTKSLLTLFIFSLIGIMLRMETVEFMLASNLTPNGNIGLIDLTINLFTSPLMSVYWILPLTFGIYYFTTLQNNFDDENLSIRLVRFQSRHSFMVNQFLSLILSIFEYLVYLLGGSFIAWVMLGHRFTENNYHFIIALSPASNILEIFAILLLHIVLGLMMVGLITQLLFLLFKNGFIVFFTLLGLCLIHTISYSFEVGDTISALLPFTQFSRGSSRLFYPFGLSVEWYTPIFQLSYLILFIFFLIVMNFKTFKHYEV